MSRQSRKHLYLPARDRSFWKARVADDLPLSYLAWGHREFGDDPIPVSQHDGWVCVLIEEGRPTITVREKDIPLTAGALVFLGPDCPFGWSPAAESECKFRLWMWATIRDERLCETYHNGHVLHYLPRKKREPFAKLHDQCRDEVLALDAHSPALLEGYARVFAALLARTLEAQPEADYASARCELAVSWMARHLDSHEPVARLCDYLNVSQSSLHRLFRSQLKASPAAHFHKLRMERAQRLVDEGDKRVKEIAFELGYEHFNDFSRAYKRYFGHSPTSAEPEE